jgi:hypothetical protein
LRQTPFSVVASFISFAVYGKRGRNALPVASVFFFASSGSNRKEKREVTGSDLPLMFE